MACIDGFVMAVPNVNKKKFRPLQPVRSAVAGVRRHPRTKATRYAGMDKMMKDPRMDPKKNPMPFDGELKKFNQADRIETLMTRQGELYDTLETDIAALEELVVELSPKEEEPEA